MVDAYIWVPHIHSTLSYSWQPLPLACECFRSNSRQWNVRQCLLKSFWKDFPILSKQNSMKWKIKFFLPLLPSSEAAVLRSCYTPFQDCSIHIPGYTYVQKQTYWRTSDLWEKKKQKKKLINRFTFLFRAIQWISIVSGQKVQDLKPCTQGHVWPGPCLTLHPFLRPHKLPYSPCFNYTGLL